MERNEKILLLQLILEDLRGNWSNPRPRANKALEFAKELELPIFVNSIATYMSSSDSFDDWDGRFFRDSHERGGYEGMEALHGLFIMKVPDWEKEGKEYPYYTFADKSDDFKKEVEDILTYPENRFEDYDPASLWPAH